MQQLTQQLRLGQPQVNELPLPILAPHHLLIQTHYSLISPGTEASTVTTARKSLIGKAKDRPQEVKRAINTLKPRGPVQTYRANMKKLDAYSPLGYSSAGCVIEVGPNVTCFQVGDPVACAGPTASHAEVVAVPTNLCVKLPPDADLAAASYNTLGAIALQGVRQADLRLGETCAVIGVGLLGQLACLLLKASGVRTFAIDIDQAAVDAAQQFAADAAWLRDTPGLAQEIAEITGGLGVDAVIITAATSSLDPINFAGEICRKRGRVVVVGAVPTGFERDPHWYLKELELRMSCSYGPGRYDPAYEEKGIDYPPAYVRWTEKRNMQAFQELVHSGQIDIGYLTTHRFPLEKAGEAYDLILEKNEPFLGILIEYDTQKPIDRSPVRTQPIDAVGELGIAFIGAGSYSQSNLLPNLTHDARIVRRSVLTRSGTTSRRVADKFHFAACVSRVEDIMDDTATNVVFVATRHDSHGTYVKQAIEAGKHVFVEKPLCLQRTELDEIARLLLEQKAEKQTHVAVDYNRRFSPHSLLLKGFFNDGPKIITYRVNAGAVAPDSWIQDPDLGGGRILGECCHFIDFFIWICNSPPTRTFAKTLPDPHAHQDTTTIVVEMADGSVCTLHYIANGAQGLPKEYIEVHQAGRSGVLNDFLQVSLYDGSRPQKHRTRSQNKGQAAIVQSYLARLLEGGEPLIPLYELYAGMDACFAALDSLASSEPMQVRALKQLANE